MGTEKFTQLKSERLYEKIVNQVKELIKEGKLKPGDQLPPERQLAATLGCSRTTVREACRVLEADGLIVSKQGGGRFVQQINQDLTPQYDYDPVNLIEKSAILHFLEVREVLEPKIVELACQRATDEDIEKLGCVLQEMKETLKHPDMPINKDFNFHLLLAESSHNFVFVSMIKSTLNMINKVRNKILGTQERYEEAFREHQIIYDMVKARDAEGASQAMKDHLQKLRAEILKNHQLDS